jgi:hypothetical protein
VSELTVATTRRTVDAVSNSYFIKFQPTEFTSPDLVPPLKDSRLIKERGGNPESYVVP